MNTSKARIGFFVIGGLMLFGIGMFLIGDRHQAFARHVEYYSEFVNLAGLADGANVRVGGMDAGKVVAIGVPGSPSSRFRVKWRIDANLRGLVRADSIATIGTEGVVGGTYLSIRPGTPKALQASALGTIPSLEPTDLSDLIARGNSLLNDADGILKVVGGNLNGTLDVVNSTVSNLNDVVSDLKQGRGTAGMLLTDESLARQIRQTVTTTASDVQGMVADMKAGRGPAGMVLRDEALAGQIRSAVTNAEQATAGLRDASRQAGELVSDLASRQLPQKAGVLMDSLNDSTNQVHQLISDISKPDQHGMSAGTNIRESLMNANTASSNLAEGSEALKHNFLLRGFFKKRGYYSLSDLLPDEYRREHAFTNRNNRRIWLSGADLFERNSGGVEELSEKGKALLNEALTENGEPPAIRPIVIEGYSNGTVAADQLRFSRGRAIQVRQYLQAHFQLDARNLGAVPLKNSPPKGMDRTTWDGICIVVLSKS